MDVRGELIRSLKEFASIFEVVWGDDFLSLALFGSFARGDFKENSDVDLILIHQNGAKALEKFVEVEGKFSENNERIKK
jgi:predicted nucleotidyltransferase